jgi:hypothetical protein
MTPDPLEELRDRLRATQEAAERLAGDIPAQGFAAPQDGEATAREVQALVAVLHTLRAAVPEELWNQVREVVRQLLLLLRALVDLIVDRLSAGPARAAEGPVVQDIPIA